MYKFNPLSGNLDYYEDISGKLDKTTDSNVVYGTDYTGTQTRWALNESVAAPWTIPLRDGNGNIPDIANIDSLPDQTNNAGKYLTTDGTDASWGIISGGAGVTIDTEDNILTSTPADPETAFATDTNFFYLWDGTNWQRSAIRLAKELDTPDIGVEQYHALQGYADDWTDGKQHFNTGLGLFQDTPYEGAIEVNHNFDPVQYRIFLRGKWNRLFYDFTMEQDRLQHIPDDTRINVNTGNSVDVGLNDVPIIRNYNVDIGAYPRPLIISGGEIGV